MKGKVSFPFVSFFFGLLTLWNFTWAWMFQSLLLRRWQGSHGPMVSGIISTGTRQVSNEGYNLKGCKGHFLERRSVLLKVTPLGTDHMSPCGCNLCIYFVPPLFCSPCTSHPESHNEWSKSGEMTRLVTIEVKIKPQTGSFRDIKERANDSPQIA